MRYPFGHGISYTDFDYTDLKLDANKATFTLTNTGKMDGAEVAQLYISSKNGSVYRPKKELKGFRKVYLKAGESKTVSIELDDKSFRYFNTKTSAWETEAGEYEIMVASSVSDVRLTASLQVDGVKSTAPAPTCYVTGNIKNVSDEDYEQILDRKIPDGSWNGELTENDAICQLYYAKSGLARLVYKILTSLKNKAEAKGKPDLNVLFIYNMPFRAIGKMAGGMVSRKMVDDILLIVNGHFFRGFGRVIADFFKNIRENSKFQKQL